MATKYEYRVSDGSGGNGKLVIDNAGRYIPAGMVGNSYFVDYRNGADTNDGKSITNAFKTLDAAYAACTSNNNDVIYIDGDSAVVITVMITWAKNRITVIGVGSSEGRLIQQGARLVMGVTGVATDLAPVLVTGTRNSFIGIKAENASTTDESLYGWIENGEGTYYQDFMSCKTAGLDDANHAHFWLAGDASSGRNLTFGHSTLQSTAAGFGILIDAKSGGATNVKENMWEDVRVNMSTDNGVVGTSCFIKVADNSAMNFNNVFDRFTGINFTPPGEAAMTDACLGTGGTSGVLNLIDPAFFGCTGVGAVTGIFTAARGLAPDANGGLATALTD